MNNSEIKNLGVLAVAGERADDFLQGQVSCNVKNVFSQELTLGVACNVKGRSLCNFWLSLDKEADERRILVIMVRELIPQMIGYWHKFSVFSKVLLSDLSAEYPVYALSRQSAQRDIKQGKFWGMELDIKQGAQNKRDCLSIDQFTDGLIKNGFFLIDQESSAKYTPHMLNLAELGAIDFDKGCYVGQEVVTRTNFLGQVKRKVFAINSHEILKVGMEINNNEENKIGEVLRVSQDGCNALAFLELKQVSQQGNIFTADGGYVTVSD